MCRFGFEADLAGKQSGEEARLEAERISWDVSRLAAAFCFLNLGCRREKKWVLGEPRSSFPLVLCESSFWWTGDGIRDGDNKLGDSGLDEMVSPVAPVSWRSLHPSGRGDGPQSLEVMVVRVADRESDGLLLDFGSVVG